MKKIQKSKILLLTLSASLGLALTSVSQLAHVKADANVNRPQTSQVVSKPTIKNQPVKSIHIKNNSQPLKRPTIYSYSNGRRTVGQNHLIHNHLLHLRDTKAAIAIDGRTGQVLYQKHANRKVLAASTGKVMTLYLAERKLARHPNEWNRNLKIPHSLVRMGRDTTLDGFHFVSGRKYPVSNLFKAAFIASDDNAAIRLGAWVGGSNRNFVHMMNKQARLWHLNAKFTSASGLENNDLARYGYWITGRRNSGNKVSAKALGIITYHLIKEFPSIMKYSKEDVAYEDGQNLVNYNYMLPGRRYYKHSLHVDGFKTGYTPAAGYCFIGSSKKPGKDRLITVSLGNHSFPEEFSSTKAIMRHVYKYSNLYRK